MIFTVTLKTPDALQDAIERAAEDQIGGSPSNDELDEQYEDLVTDTKNICKKWFEYGEMVSLTIDTEKETCVVESI